VSEAVVENQEAHNTMADYFFSDGAGVSGVIMALADAFYETAIDRGNGRASDLGATPGGSGRPHA
jgi:type I restriction enzyme R subunit